jgi:hypothetical protein
MVLLVGRYFIDKDKITEYVKFAKEVAIPYWLSVPGLKEFRAYRDEMSGLVIVELEFESYQAWGKAMEDEKTKNLCKLRRGHRLLVSVVSPSPKASMIP